MYNVLFVGKPEALSLAFPPELRREIAQRVQVLTGEFHGEEWHRHTETLSEVDFIFASWGMPRLDAIFLAAMPRLKAIFYAAGSVKYFATHEAYARGILITSAWEANAIPVAEYAHATILLSLKSFWRFIRQSPAKKFEREEIAVPGAYKSSKVGLVSLGAVGRSVAARFAANEVSLLAYDPFFSPEAAAKLGITLVTLPELFAQSDVVSIHAPWLPETEHLINGALVASMKPGATLINTSRGALLHEAEVSAVLRERSDLTAILDVTHPEPPAADSPLRTLGNVILTPHIAGSLGNEITRMGYWAVDEMNRFLEHQSPRHSITKEMMARMA